MLKVLRALTQLLTIWWTKDRIRVARSEGKLLRIQVGDRLLIDDKIFHVLTRREDHATINAQVLYTLVEEHTAPEDVWCLSCRMRSETSTLSFKGESRCVLSDHVDVLVSPT